jgi:hypothetical protein
MISAHLRDASDASTSAVNELEAHVRLLLKGRARDLQVVFAGRGLILRGGARTYYVKQLAQHAIMEATHLPIVSNEIEVTHVTPNDD